MSALPGLRLQFVGRISEAHPALDAQMRHERPTQPTMRFVGRISEAHPA
ncbi:hypothetical protein V4Y02_05545 [Escherichia coli]|nr:hypothetical protein [Escherichia coli]HAI3698034.1 hypothetical protein [Escherichia coli]